MTRSNSCYLSTVLRTCIVTLIALSIAIPHLVSAQENPHLKITKRYIHKTGHGTPNSPLLCDLNEDDVADLVISDREGNLIAFNLLAEEIYRTAKFTGALSAPAMGDFYGNNTFDLAVLKENGELILVDGTKLEEIGRVKVAESTKSLIAPTAFPIMRDGKVARDGIIIIDDNGKVIVWHFDNEKPEKLWEKDFGPVVRPVTIANVFDLETPQIVVSTTDGRIIVCDSTDPENVISHKFENFGGISTIVAARNTDGVTPFDELYAVTDTGYLVGLRYNQSGHRLDEIFQPVSVFPAGTNVLDPVIIAYRESDFSKKDNIRIILSDGKSLVSYTTEGRHDVNSAFKPDGQIVSEISYLESSTVGPTVSFADNTGTIYFLHPRYLHESARQRVVSTESGDKTPEQFVQGPLILDAKGTSRAYFVLLTADTGRVVYYESDVALAPDQIVWQTRNGNTFHTCSYNEVLFADLKERKKSLQARREAIMEKARLAIQEERWKDALASLDIYLESDPRNPQAMQMHDQAWKKINGPKIVIAAVAGLLISLIVGFFSFRVYRISNWRKKASQAFAAQDWDTAVTYYKKLRAKRPDDKKVLDGLSAALIRKKDFSKENIPLFELMHKQDRENLDYVNALAHCYVQREIVEDKARTVYERALNIWDEKAELHFLLGKIHLERDDYEEASNQFKEAIRKGRQDPETYEMLADCYVQMKYYSSKALPVYMRVLNKKKSDASFLEATCMAVIDARKMDEEGESVSQALLALKPDHVPASTFLAQVNFQRGNVKEAARMADNVLKIDKNNKQALLLLSQCLLVEGRTDDGALNVYLNTLGYYPDDMEILTILAHHYYAENDFSEETIPIYQRAYAANPKDAIILKAMAQASLGAGNHTVAIDTLEGLIDLGQGNKEIYTRLAECYAATECFDVKTEKAYRTALSENPDNETYLNNLAVVLVRANKTDVDAIKVFEKILSSRGGSEDIGAQLARSYMENNNFEAAIKLTSKLIVAYPENSEIRRIQALASLHGDQLDQAIAQYTSLLKLNPEDGEALVNLAMAYSLKGRLDDEAARLYTRALQSEPNNEQLRLILAHVFASRGEMQKCIQEFKNVLKISSKNLPLVKAEIDKTLAEYPESTPLRWFLVEMLVKMNHLRDAIEQLNVIYEANPAQSPQIVKTLEYILKKDPKNLAAFIQLGIMLRLSENYVRARGVLERAFDLYPESSDLQKQLAEVYEKILSESENMEVRFHLGNVYSLMGLFDKAIGCFQKTEQDFRWESDSVKMLGKCFLAKGMLDLAFQAYQRTPVDDELKELLYDLAQHYEADGDIVGAKQVYKIIFASDINFRDVREKFEMLSGTTSEPVSVERTSLMNELSENARRRYELLDELGRGAMGIVYRAKDVELDEVVALKILPDNLSNNPEAVRRFKIEARSARRLAHPNIVRIHDIGEEMGRKYISMEYIEGTDLKKIIRKHKKLDDQSVVLFARQIADALGYAHSMGIVHRDIKPANIMITNDNRVKIADYGIAKMVEGTDATVAGAVIGTPLYMAPEQVKGDPIDHRVDIYSFGILLYELLNGRPPFFEGDLAYQHTHKDPPPLDGVDKELAAVVMKCLEKDPVKRYDSGRDILNVLIQISRRFGQTTSS